MIIFPAIDLKDGQCVRLKKGVMEDATVFNADPAAQAKIFQAQNFEWLHCVDLNGAFAGKSANAAAIRNIRAAITLPIQLGGGIRDLAAVEGWLAAGISRVILGTAALTDPAFVKEAAKKFPGRLFHKFRIGEGRGPQNDAGDAGGQPTLHRRQIANAAAKLDGQGHGGADFGDRGGIGALAGKGAVKVDAMQPFKILRLKELGLGAGIGIEHGGVIHHAFLQAHALPILQVNGGKDNHGFQRRKFSSSFRPVAWLFSG